jgi:glycerol transport system permease protein
MDKPYNNKAWFLVIPVFRAGCAERHHPDHDGDQLFVPGHLRQQPVLLGRAPNGSRTCCRSDRFWNALGRNLVFSLIILSIEIPLGIAIALTMPKKGIWVPVCLVLMALPLLIPVERCGHDLADLRPRRHRLLGHTLEQLGFEYNYASNVFCTPG